MGRRSQAVFPRTLALPLLVLAAALPIATGCGRGGEAPGSSDKPSVEQPPPPPPPVNHPPVFTPVADPTIDEGTTLRLVVVASDPDGGPVALSVSVPPGLPANATFDATAGELVFQPDFTQAGTFGIVFTATDQGSPPLSATLAVTITVVDVPVVPTSPVVVIASPVDGTLTRVPQQVVAGTVDDSTIASVTLELNGTTQAIPAPLGIFDDTVTLEEGLNAIVITAANPAGTGTSGLVRVTLDTTAPVVTIDEPAPSTVVFGTSVRVRGRVDDPAATVRVDGVLAPLTANRFEVPAVPLPVLGLTNIVIDAADPAGNTASVTVPVERRASVLESIAVVPGGARLTALGATLPLRVAGIFSDGVTIQDLTADPSTTYASGTPLVATVTSDGVVTAVANGSTTITVGHLALSASAVIVVEAGVTLQSFDIAPPAVTLRAIGETRQLACRGTFSDGSERDLTAQAAGTSYESSDASVAAVSADGLVTAVGPGDAAILAVSEGLFAETRVLVDIPAAPGFVRGEVYDDTLGLVLPGATATLLQDGSGPLDPPPAALADAAGQYALLGLDGEALVRIAKPGFTTVEREGAIPLDTAVTLLDARLTPLDAAPSAIPSALGGRARNAAGTVSLDLLPGALASDADILLTAVSPQGLAGKLPLGWSPAAAVEIGPAGLVFGQPAVLRVPNTLRLAPATTVVAARYDSDAHAWIALASAQVSGDASEVLLPLAGAGQVALLVPDAAPAAVPPQAIPGEPLAGVAPVAIPPSPDASATGASDPVSAPPGPEARSMGTIVVTTASPLPSGTVIEGRVDERYDLIDATVARPAPFVQDLVLYAFPRPPSATLVGPALGATFPITPSRDFTIDELSFGIVEVAGTDRSAAIGGAIISPAGGAVTVGEVAVVIAPAALATPTVVDLVALAAPDLPVAVPQGTGLLGAVQLDLSSATLASSAVLSIARPPALSPSAQIVVAQVFADLAGARRLRIVAVGEVTARVSSRVLIGSSALPGITASGTYLFLEVPAAAPPLGFVTGVVLGAPAGGPAAGPAPGALVTADTAPFADLADAQGRYLVAGTVGDVALTAQLQSTGDGASDSTTIPARDEVVALDLALGAVPPTVTSVAPAAGARNVPLDTSIRVDFSEPVDPASVRLSGSFTVTPAGGAPEAGTVRVAPDGRSATFTPAASLAPGTVFTVALAPAIVDGGGNALVAFTPTAFTTFDPATVRDPAGQISVTAPDANGRVTITGTTGTAEAGQAVSILNNTTGVIETVVAGADGSFTVTAIASTTDVLTVRLRTASGTDSVVQIASYRHADGSVTIGELGGTVSVDTADGPIALAIPAGALAAAVQVTITPVTEAETRAELARLGVVFPEAPAFPLAPSFAGAFRIDAPGGLATSKLTLSVPVPPTLEAEAVAAGRTLAEVQATLVRVEEFTDPDDGTRKVGLFEQDSAKVEGGRLTTASPPFAGVGGVFSGFYIFFAFPPTFTAYVNGLVFIATDPRTALFEFRGEPFPSPDPAIAPLQKARAGGAIVRVSATFQSSLFFSRADEAGHYAATVPLPQGALVSVNARRLDAEAPGASTAAQVQPGSPLAPARELILKLRPPPPDTTPPNVRILLSSAAAPAGARVTITVVATDNDNRPASLATLEASLALTSTFTPAGPSSVSPNQPTPLQRDPADGRFKATLDTNVEGTYQLEATAFDASGNGTPASVNGIPGGRGSISLTVGPPAPVPGVNLQGVDPEDQTPPFVVGIDPPAGAAGVAPASVIAIRFSEPVDRAVTARGASGVPLFIQVAPQGRGPVGGTVTLSSDQTVATFRPTGGLDPGTVYQVTVVDVLDLPVPGRSNGNPLDQNPITSGADPFESAFATLDEVPPTEIPGLEFNIRTGRSSTVLGSTLFLTEGDSTTTGEGRILIFDISNPTAPVRISEIAIDGQPRALTVVPEFSYLGLDNQPTFPPRQGFVGDAPLARRGALLVAAVFKPLGAGLAGSFLQFYDVTDPARPLPIGFNHRISFDSTATKVVVAGGSGGAPPDRVFVKLVDRPNPGLAVIDLRLALVKGTLLPLNNQRRLPDGSLVSAARRMIDANGSGADVIDFPGLDQNGDGDIGDASDLLPDINDNTDIVVGRLVTPGDTTDFAVNRAGTLVFVADGLPVDRNGIATDQEPSTGLTGPFYGGSAAGPPALPADASGGLVIADMTAFFEGAPFVDLPPLPGQAADGIDDRVLARINTPVGPPGFEENVSTPSTRVTLAEQQAFLQRVITIDPTTQLPVTTAEAVVRDLAFVSNAQEGTVTVVDVDDPRRPLRLAAVKLPIEPKSLRPLQPLELTVLGRRLLVATGSGSTVEIDLDQAVVVDRTQPQAETLPGLRPIDEDNDQRDDRIVRTLAGVPGPSGFPGVPGSGAFDGTGHAYAGSSFTEQISRVDLPRLEIVRFDGTKADLASLELVLGRRFNPTEPGDRDNAPFLARLVPVGFLVPGRLHDVANDPGATDDGDRDETEFVYYVRTTMPAGAGATAAQVPDGSVPLTLEALDFAGQPIPDQGFAFPPVATNAPRPSPTQQPPLLLYRQIATRFLAAQQAAPNAQPTEGQRVSPLATTYLSAPFFVTREPFQERDLQPAPVGSSSPPPPFVIWAGATVRASLAGAATPTTNVGAIYVPGVPRVVPRTTSQTPVQQVLASAKVELRTVPAEFLDSPDPSPKRGTSGGMGEAGSPVHVHSGELRWTQVDLAIKGRGLDYTFVRTYENQSLYNGPLGRGFDFHYNARLLELPDDLPAGFLTTLVRRPGGANIVARPRDLIAFDGMGRADVYRFDGDGPDASDPDELLVDPPPQGLGLNTQAAAARHYTSPPGFFTKMLKLRDGTFALVERDGTVRRFSVYGKLTSITDRNGNRLDLTYDTKLRLRTIIDPLGRAIQFGYYKVQADTVDEPDFVVDLDEDDPAGAHAGKLARQRDFIDREIEYLYDGENRLVEVILPDVTGNDPTDSFAGPGLRKSTKYEYAQGRLAANPRMSFGMEAIFDPVNAPTAATPRIRNTYDTDGKLRSQVWGDPNAGQTTSFAYSGSTTTVTDRRGHETRYTHEPEGRATGIVQLGAGLPPTGLSTSQGFNADGLVELEVLPEGNQVERVYDAGNPRRRAQGNLLLVTRRADAARGPNGSAAQLTTTYESYQRHNFFQRALDPRRFETTYTYDDRGNLRQVTRPASTGIVETMTYNDFGQMLTSVDGEGNETQFEYHPEGIPDGLTPTPSTPLRQLTSTTGGYLRAVTADAVHVTTGNVGFVPRPAGPPAPTSLRTTYEYNDVGPGYPGIGYAGNWTAMVDARGVRTERSINSLNQVFRMVAATTGTTDGSGQPALRFEQRVFYDRNNRVVRREVQHDGDLDASLAPVGTKRLTQYTYTYSLIDDLRSITVQTLGAGAPGNEPLQTFYLYDEDQNLVAIQKPEGNVDGFAYDARRLMTRATRGLVLDPATGALLVTPDTSATDYFYDDNGNLTVIRDGRFPTTGADTVVAYDGYDRQMQVTDRMGNRTLTTYDDNSLVVTGRRLGPAGGQGPTPTPPPSANLLQSVTFFYDEIYRRTRMEEEILPAPTFPGVDATAETRFFYDRVSRVIRVEDDNGQHVDSYFDGAGRLIARIDQIGNEIALTLDPGGNPIVTTETEQPSGGPAGSGQVAVQFVSTATFDALGRVVETVDPPAAPGAPGHRRRRLYDAQSNLIRMEDAEGNVIRSVFDLAGRRTAMIQDLQNPPAGQDGEIRTLYDFDLNSRLESMTDDSGNATTYAYDALDRGIQTTFPDGTTEQVLSYDKNDNVEILLDQNGNRVTTEYDANDRAFRRTVQLARARLSGSRQDLDAILEEWEYDGLDRMTLARDEDTVVERVYDSLGRVVEESETARWTSPNPIRTTTRNAFDGVGNRLRVGYPDGSAVEYGYDDLDRLETVASPASPVPGQAGSTLATYGYIGRARMTSRTLANGVDTTMAYDGDRRLIALTHAGTPAGAPRASLFDFRYAWSAEDRRLGEQRMHEGGTADVYTYDSIYRVTQARRGTRLAPALAGGPIPVLDALAASAPGTLPTTGGAGVERSYVQDGVHNLQTAAATVPDPRLATRFPEAFAIDAPAGPPPSGSRNQYETLTEGAAPRSQTYDANGNTLTLRLGRRTGAGPTPVADDATVTFDYRDQPIVLALASGGQILYRYDVLGRRVEKRIEAAGGAVIEETRFLHDGAREIEERDASDGTLARYVYGVGLDDPLAMDRRPNAAAAFVRRFYHANSIGSIVGLTDDAGREVERYRYDVYGEPILEAADYTPPEVQAVRVTGAVAEIDFTEPLAPLDFAGLVDDGSGTLATAVELLETPGPLFRATLRATFAAPPAGVRVSPSSGANRLLDTSLNVLAAPFTAPAIPFTNPAAPSTGARPIALSEAGNPWLFQGRRLDPESGLYYYRARYYDPSTGRFLQNDPKGYVDGPNLYAAFGNDPVNRVDPMGKSWWDLVFGGDEKTDESEAARHDRHMRTYRGSKTFELTLVADEAWDKGVGWVDFGHREAYFILQAKEGDEQGPGVILKYSGWGAGVGDSVEFEEQVAREFTTDREMLLKDFAGEASIGKAGLLRVTEGLEIERRLTYQRYDSGENKLLPVETETLEIEMPIGGAQGGGGLGGSSGSLEVVTEGDLPQWAKAKFLERWAKDKFPSKKGDE